MASVRAGGRRRSRCPVPLAPSASRARSEACGRRRARRRRRRKRRRRRQRRERRPGTQEVPRLCCRFSGTCPAARTVGVCVGELPGRFRLETRRENAFVFKENESSEGTLRVERGPAGPESGGTRPEGRPHPGGWKGWRDPPKTGCRAWCTPSQGLWCGRWGWLGALCSPGEEGCRFLGQDRHNSRCDTRAPAPLPTCPSQSPAPGGTVRNNRWFG